MGSFVLIIMKHYYTNNEELISNPEQFVFHYRDHDLYFTSDNGVFSKKMIDYGSRVLLNAIELDESKLAGLKYQGVDLWDSVGHMTLVANLEDTFDVMLETDDIVELSSYEKGIEILKEKYGIEF